MTTWISASKSPADPFLDGTPRPLTRSLVPLDVLGGTLNVTTPRGVGRSTLAPAAASPNVTGTRSSRLLPRRWKHGCGAT